MKNSRRLCAVVPAAGRGSRLGLEMPKVFAPILPDLTIWETIHRKLLPLADAIVLVLSPEGRDFLKSHRKDFPATSFEKTEITVQPRPLGMGDAIFGAADCWHEYDELLVIWGDQFNVAPGTLRACVDLHRRGRSPAVTLPLVRAPQPYVEYVFDPAGALISVRQLREGDTCAPNGFSDVGVFLLSAGPVLVEEWRRYREATAVGSATGEINFLPFLVHLSSTAGWAVNCHESRDPAEAIGINTPEDLALARQLLQKKSLPEKLS